MISTAMILDGFHFLRFRKKNILRAYRPNQMGFREKLEIYLSRWWEFLSKEPGRLTQKVESSRPSLGLS